MSSPSNNNYSESVDDSSLTIISPPLSPYPKLLQPVTVVKSCSDGNSPGEVITYATTPCNDSNYSNSNGLKIKSDHSRVDKADSAKNVFTSNAWSLLKKDPVGYFKRERAWLDLYPMNGPTWSNYIYVDGASAAAQAAVTVVKPVPSRSRLPRRFKRNQASSDNDSDTATSSITTRSATSRGRETFINRDRTPVGRVISSNRRPTSRPGTPRRPGGSRSNTSSPAPSRVHDTSLSQLEDFSPEISTLPPGKSLRAEWKGAPMDLTNDPNVHLLHPAEMHLASVLRLPADIYLDSKKRLFAEKVHRLKQGLPFRRTDSQKACRIDVNKASRLFSAYERVGWLEDHLFLKYL